MDIRDVILYECRIDGEFKEVSKDIFHCIVKSKFDKCEGASSIVLIEVNKQQLSYLETYEYRDNEVGHFDIKGTFEVRKNKKDIPFLLLKAISVRLSAKRVADNKKKLEKKKEKKKKEKLENNLDNNSEDFSKWHKKIELLGLEKKVLDATKIKLLDEEHLKHTIVDFSKKYVLNKELIAVVEPIKDSDEYKLILGWKPLITAKLFDKEITCYITNKTKDELRNELANIKLYEEDNLTEQ